MDSSTTTTSDLREKMKELREKRQTDQRITDSGKFDKQQREFRNELAIKKAEVEALRQELSTANEKIHKLQTVLDKTKTELDEKDLNLTLSRKKYQNLEEKWQKDQENRLQNQIQCNMMKSEITTLKQHVQYVAAEKYELNRKVTDFEARHKYHVIFQDELEQRQARIEAILKETKTTMEKYANEHEKLLKISETTDTIKQLNVKCDFYARENVKILRQKTEIEESLIKTKAECDKFEELLTKHPEITDKDAILKIIHAYWAKSSDQYKQLLTDKNATINKLTTTLKVENETNVKLILDKDDQTKKIHELEEKLAEVEKKLATAEAPEVIQIKSEVIEFIDD